MRFIPLLTALLFPLAATAQQPATHPVVVELFTSQGCSSCPPADKVLSSYADDPNILPLSFHVSYWNYLGWNDPYSQDAFNQRQRHYSKRLNSRVYTPQLVVQGSDELIGSHKARVNSAIVKQQRSTPWIPISIEDKGNAIFTHVAAGIGDKAELILIGYKKQTHNIVPKGENSGRTLAHTNTVLNMTAIAQWHGKAFTLSTPRPKGGSIAVILQSKKTGKILGAAWK